MGWYKATKIAYYISLPHFSLIYTRTSSEAILLNTFFKKAQLHLESCSLKNSFTSEVEL
jgi:hypothetical protein